MSNYDHPLWVTPFYEIADNAAKSNETTWGKFSDSLIAGHTITDLDKFLLPLFSPWRYKDVSDPSVDNGLYKNGQPVKRFSPTHVRRLQTNLLDLWLLVLDCDRVMRITEVDRHFGGYEYVCYTSLNHQTNGDDKFRVVLPLVSPMEINDFKRLQPVMAQWAVEMGVDGSTFDIGRMFILPAVREEYRDQAKAWRNRGRLFDWKIFESMSMDSKRFFAVKRGALRPASNKELMPDDVLQTRAGFIKVRDIDRKISYVACPFHGDINPSEFVDVTQRGTPFLVCKKCGTIYMDKGRVDPIADAIAKIRSKRQDKGGTQ